MYNPFTLSGKTILVTGASSGIGRAVAIECSKMEANIVITGRNNEQLGATFTQLCGNNHQQIVTDLSNLAVLDEFVAAMPLLNGVVHCAGKVQTLPFSFAHEEKLKSIMDINFMAPTLISAQLVKKKKLDKGASIVFISSISGVLCSELGNSMYSASKGALNGISKGMALDLAPKGIRVNTVMPGMIDTNILASGTITPEQLEENKKRYPLKRFGKPEEVAHAVIYLLSDASQWVTGSNLLIDGGLTLQ